MKLPVVLPRVRVLNFRATVAVSGTIAQGRNCALFTASQRLLFSFVISETYSKCQEFN